MIISDPVLVAKSSKIELFNTLIATEDISVNVDHVACYRNWGLPTNSWIQECTNPRCQITWTTKFCTVAPNICGSSV
jgi:hypothetical protein